ncbi:RNA polymerase sigma-70 [Macleaya cordata]|uniref:RNA polymerase sigma-70 n=1 Tax=Macleaya cordata TaxID=56857 RepID=A0A200PY05_MACCD|nr:RNA polymerase sigma-70 [Macleaya cordata]
MVKRQLMKHNLHKLLNTVLGEREERILRLHFGLNGETPRSCDEIGRLLYLSRERVRQIRGLALAKLREASSVLDI